MDFQPKRLPKLLSKSKIMRGYRCHKSIYNTIHRAELEPAITPEQRHTFDQGAEVGVKARDYYPGGTLVDCKPWEFVDSLKKTRELIQSGVESLYEAAFEYKGCYARADILRYNRATQRWTLLEVKSTTKVKPEHIEDVGLQAWIIANSGIKLERIGVVHLNRECRYPDLRNLFVEEDVTERLREHYPDIAPRLNGIFSALRQPTVPEIDLGPHCTAYGRDCEFKSACWSERAIPEISVFNIPRLKEKVWELYRRGQVALKDIDLSALDEAQRRIVESHLSGERHLNADGVRLALRDWRYPLVFLDFETINPAIPCYDGTSPYQQVPFQFSAHVQRAPDGPLEHHEYLHDDLSDPRPALIEALLAACAEAGSIISYFARFEAGCIEDLAEFAPDRREALQGLLGRLVDPLPIVRENLYDVGFAGSFSLKAVAPALLGTEFSYAGMEIGDGSAAQRGFQQLVREASPERKARLRQAMLEYCRKDTLGMVKLVEALRRF